MEHITLTSKLSAMLTKFNLELRDTSTIGSDDTSHLYSYMLQYKGVLDEDFDWNSLNPGQIEQNFLRAFLTEVLDQDLKDWEILELDFQTLAHHKSCGSHLLVSSSDYGFYLTMADTLS